MGRFASGKYALGECDRCGFAYPYLSLKRETRIDRKQNLYVCHTCWDPSHPQETLLRKLRADDPQALQHPRPQGNLAQQRQITRPNYPVPVEYLGLQSNDPQLNNRRFGRGAASLANSTGVGAGGLTSAWDPANKSVYFSLNADATIASAQVSGFSTSGGVRGLVGKTAGKWYFETANNLNAPNSAAGYFGIARSTWDYSSNAPGLDPGAASKGWTVATNGYRYHDGFVAGHMNGNDFDFSNLPGLAGTRSMFAVDLDNGRIYFGTNGTWRYGGDPAAGTGASFTDVTGTIYPAANLTLAADQFRSVSLFTTTANTLYTPPTGFSLWN